MSEYYDGTKLLSLMDINGDKPEIFITTGNRSSGKTTFFSRLCVNAYKRKNEKFMLVYRYNYELDDCADKFFKDIKGLFFQEDELTSEKRAKGIYHELFLNGVSCGYAISLNSADQIKKNAHLFSDVCRMFFDEFQSETNHYCSDEVIKLQSIHMSVARGQSKMVRYVPVYMVSNNVSIINPYFTAMGISSRLRKDTKFLRGEGFVLESNFNEVASKAQSLSGFNRAFSGSSYIQYASTNVYLNDNIAFIEKPQGKSRYLATLKYKNKEYALREYTDIGIIYCDDKADNTFYLKISVTTDDHQINYVMLKRSSNFISTMRFFFERGCLRFKNLECKEAVLCALSY